MKTTIQTDNGLTAAVDIDNPIVIAIALQFNGPQPNAYGVEAATAAACEYGELVGDTRRGGSCNFERISLIPHCSGTHTECVGHITNERISVTDCLSDVFMTAVLVSVEPEPAGRCGDTYSVPFGPDDTIISRGKLAAALNSISPASVRAADSALIVRSLPNGADKMKRKYDAENVPTYFSSEAMALIVELGFKHLLVDFPSIDRLFDEGKLANHRRFWNVEPGSNEISGETRLTSTVTELIFVPDETQDGVYLLNLQIAPFVSDTSPSRPILFRASADRSAE